MDAVEFAKTMREICRSHTSCVECEFVKVQGHCGITNPEADHAGMVAVAEQWAREHVEKGTEEESRNVLELMVALTDKVDRLEEKIKVAENMIEESRCVTDATFGEVDERFAEVDAQIERVDERITLCMQMNGGTKKKNKRKRKRKYALLAVLPNVDTSACPKVLDMNYKCDKRKLCAVCKHEFWNEEVEG